MNKAVETCKIMILSTWQSPKVFKENIVLVFRIYQCNWLHKHTCYEMRRPEYIVKDVKWSFVQFQEDDRFCFIAEWYDPNAALIRRYQFLFYVRDNTMEMVKNYVNHIICAQLNIKVLCSFECSFEMLLTEKYLMWPAQQNRHCVRYIVWHSLFINLGWIICQMFSQLEIGVFCLQYDPKNRRIFLKRSKADGVRLEDLYIGSTINVLSRQLNFVDYGDEYTKTRLSRKKERSLNFWIVCGTVSLEGSKQKQNSIKVKGKNIKFMFKSVRCWKATSWSSVFKVPSHHNVCLDI